MDDRAILIRGGRLIDPAQNIDDTLDLLIAEGRVRQIARSIAGGGRVISAKGLWVVPGLIDMHVHLREPGRCDKEDIESGARAAVAGGFSAVASMANGDIPVDNEAAVGYVLARAREVGLCRVHPIGAVTRGLRGEELAEMALMAQAGAMAFSDDGMPVMSSRVMRRALEYSKMLRRPIISHCEDAALTKPDGVMNEGPAALRLGLKGMPGVAEEIMATRDIALARHTGGRLHIAHVSDLHTVEAIRRAKREGVRVTCEVTPHHLAVTDEALAGYSGRFKMNPPLRSGADVDAMIDALADGTIDAIASDHAPHTVDEKEDEITRVPFGVVGLETTLGVILTRLAHEGRVPVPRLIAAMTLAPARILGVNRGTLAPGADADLTLIDPDATWICDPREFASKARATPFEGWKMRGRAVMTLVGGRIVFER